MCCGSRVDLVPPCTAAKTASGSGTWRDATDQPFCFLNVFVKNCLGACELYFWGLRGAEGALTSRHIHTLGKITEPFVHRFTDVIDSHAVEHSKQETG